MPGATHIVSHPLVQHKLTLMRRESTSVNQFRQLLEEISMLLAYEVCRDLPMTMVPIETPIAPMSAPVLDGKKIVLVSIMRSFGFDSCLVSEADILDGLVLSLVQPVPDGGRS